MKYYVKGVIDTINVLWTGSNSKSIRPIIEGRAKNVTFGENMKSGEEEVLVNLKPLRPMSWIILSKEFGAIGVREVVSE